MEPRGIWDKYDALSDDQQEDVYEAVLKRHSLPRAQSQHMSDEEVNDLTQLLAVLQQERKRLAVAKALERFLPE